MNSFRDKLVQIQKELTNYKNHDKIELMKMYVENRIKGSVDIYYSQMRSYAEALSSYNSIKVLRRINKGEKNDL